MEALERLSLDFLVEKKKATTIDLNKHLQTFPASLKYLYVHCTPYRPLDEAIVDLMNMNKLVPLIDTSNVAGNPHLSEVSLVVTRVANITLLLPYSNLDDLIVVSTNFTSSYYVLIEVMDDNKSVLFKVKSGVEQKRVSKELENWPRLVVKVQSVKSVEVQNVDIDW
jgi:hypothetical protein